MRRLILAHDRGVQSLTNTCPECGFEAGSEYGLRIHSRICKEIKKAKSELRTIWRSGIPTTWSDRKIERWKDLIDKLREMGVDTTKQHFFLEDSTRNRARTLKGGGDGETVRG